MASKLAFVQAGISPSRESLSEVLTDEAQTFLRELHDRFESERQTLLEARTRREAPGFLASTEAIRRADWKVAPVPRDLERREVEITGPVERRMMAHALYCGADVFMADFEDSLSPTWKNVIEGHKNVMDAARGLLVPSSENSAKPATLVVRPRGWHLLEQHALADDSAVSASLFDFGLFFFHNAKELIKRGSGPYVYLPKLENHVEARLWNEVFCFAQDHLHVPRGTIRATVLIETLPAAFEMQEILFELRDHAAGLNAGRWDYLFSVIKTMRDDPAFLLPDRSQLMMTVPFMRAYSKMVVETCKRRGAQAIGGMAAFVPSRKDPAGARVAMSKVADDKRREANDGFDGTWVAHPDLVAVAREAFSSRRVVHLNHGGELDERAATRDLLDFHVPGGKITAEGVLSNIDVCVRYLSSWLAGRGSVAIRSLMEDAATAEIARSLLWLWVNRKANLQSDHGLDAERFDELLMKALEAIPLMECPRKREAGELLRDLVLSEELVDFLTLEAYPLLAFSTGAAA